MSKLRNKINQDVWFVKNDIVKVPRSTFFRNQDIKTTFNAGKLVPFYVDEILPGDTYELQMNSVVRFASTMIKPVMDDVLFEAWCFFVPSRLLDDNFEKVIANYKPNPDWTSDVDTTLSTLSIPVTGFGVQSVGDYMGLPAGLPSPNKSDEPVKASNTLISLLPFRGYTMIWDFYFRDQNLQNAITLEHAGYQALDGVATADGDYVTDAVLGGALCPLNKRHDLFTSALPAPQKGAPVTIGLSGNAPLVTTDTESNFIPLQVTNNSNLRYDVGFETSNSGATTTRLYRFGAGYDLLGTGDDHDITHGVSSTGGSGVSFDVDSSFDAPAYERSKFRFGTYLDNAYADLGRVTGISVNDLRVLFQTQKLKEQDARYGSRYAEYLLGSWGVVSGDARLQRPEFLGKLSFNLNVNQVIQTNAGDGADSGLANQGAYSLTANTKKLCSKSFTEHGYIFIVGGVRIKNRTYSRNVNKMFSKVTRLQFYNPVYANLGEQAIKNQEIYWDPTGDTQNNGAFGYQENAYEYRYLPNKATGYMRPEIDNSLAVWTYAEAYSELPTLSSGWMVEDIAPLDRSLSVPSKTGANFIADIYVKNKATRPMPLHSIPGLVDHSGKIIL